MKTKRWKKEEGKRVLYRYGKDKPGPGWVRAGYWKDGEVITDEPYYVEENWHNGYKVG